MKGDFSRRTFDRWQHYTSVLMQQGRVLVDNDWNEQRDLDLYRTRVEASDVIGRCGGPRDYAGFGLRTEGQRLIITAGRYYVLGLLCENDQDVEYAQQPDLPNPPDIAKTLREAGTPYAIVYLDAWLHHLTELDDPRLHEVALGDADTTTRVKTVWQVKVLPVTADTGQRLEELQVERQRLEEQMVVWRRERQALQDKIKALEHILETLKDDDPQRREVEQQIKEVQAQLTRVEQRLQDNEARLRELDQEIDALQARRPGCGARFPEWDALTRGGGQLNARTQPVPDADVCELPPTAGYTRLENQLYRVEIHAPGNLGQATYKWSRNNGTVVTLIERVNGREITVASIGRDEMLGFADDQWVELSDDTRELNGLPGEMAQIETVRVADRVVVLTQAPARPLDLTRRPKMRGWDQAGPTVAAGVVPTSGAWTDLEDGIQVQFSGDNFRTGDYWLIPARTATGEIEWPPYAVPNRNPLPQSRAGIVHSFCRLAFVQLGEDDTLTVVQDCRKLFDPLTLCVPDALHVVGANWDNDDVLLLGQWVEQGLRITLDYPPDPRSITNHSVVVAADAGNERRGTVLMPRVLQTVTLVGDVRLDPNDPRTIVWSFQPGDTSTIKSVAQAQSYRIRVTLKGHLLWGYLGDTRLYLDGQAFGVPGWRSDNRTPRTALVFPSGATDRASDFESWFLLDTPQAETLQVTQVTFLQRHGEGEIVAVDIDTRQAKPAPVRVPTRVNVIRLTFSREISETAGIGRLGNPQCVLVERDILGDVQLVGANVLEFQLQDPHDFSNAQEGQPYRLIVFGTQGDKGHPPVTANDGSLLDGDFNGQPGGDFNLDFIVIHEG